jgi:SPX domain protein involved in polyphosphate accumulation|tara:strand:- start:1721 stop:2437 length:717 start_codon:yes stop_codon:yes gene_type:complete
MSKSKTKNIENYRYERKFVISSKHITKNEIENIIKLHPAIFREIYSERYVRNIYFDLIGLDNYLENVDGNTDRVKVRIRWYGNMLGQIKTPILELKIKKGLLGTKKQFSLSPFVLSDNINTINSIDFFSLIENSGITNQIDRLKLKSIIPQLLNGYKRRYFLSNDKKYRITIDSEQVFSRLGKRNNSLINKYKNNSTIVLELKYNFSDDKDVEKITKHFPFRLSKNSKYVNGINICYL